MTEMQRRFLKALAAEPKGRVAYRLVERARLMEHVGGLLDDGYIIERRHGHEQGLQITPLGKEYLGGMP